MLVAIVAENFPPAVERVFDVVFVAVYDRFQRLDVQCAPFIRFAPATSVSRSEKNHILHVNGAGARPSSIHRAYIHERSTINKNTWRFQRHLAVASATKRSVNNHYKQRIPP